MDEVKAVLMSIRPNWCEKILNGEKAVEIRKTKPRLEVPFKVFVYCTKAVKNVCHEYCEDDLAVLNVEWRGGGKKYGNPYGFLHEGEELLNQRVIAEFTCDRINAYCGRCNTQKDLDYYFPGSCLKFQQYNDYCNSKGIYRMAYGWHISDLKIYDRPKMLKEIHSPFYPSCYNFMSNVPCDSDCEFRFSCLKLPRAPQSWCYVEEELEENQNEKA